MLCSCSTAGEAQRQGAGQSGKKASRGADKDAVLLRTDKAGLMHVVQPTRSITWAAVHRAGTLLENSCS